MTHKYYIGQEVNLQTNDCDNLGNPGCVAGKIVNIVFFNGKPAYDIQDRQGYIIHNVPEEYKK